MVGKGMAIMGGVFHALALLLALAGIAKLVRPAGVTAALDELHLPGWNVVGRLPVARLLGLGEVVVAALAVTYGGRGWAIALTACFAAFALVAWRLSASAATDCGCFGAAGAAAGKVGPIHIAVDIGFTVAAAATVLDPPAGFGSLGAPGHPLVPYLIVVGALTAVGYLMFTALPALAAARRKVLAG
jgi:hypothetical protein